MYLSQLRLSVQTNIDKIEECKHFKCKAWAPKKAKSYTISDYRHTDYDGMDIDKPTGYGDFVASYYSSKREGKFTL